MNFQDHIRHYFMNNYDLSQKELHIIDHLVNFKFTTTGLASYFNVSIREIFDQTSLILSKLKVDSLFELPTFLSFEKNQCLKYLHPSAPIKVLIVDDEPGAPELISRVFKEKGWSATCASRSSLNLIEEIDSNKTDLIISDVNMPKMDGLKFTALCREKLTHYPVIIIMTAGTTYSEKQYYDAGANFFLNKPFENSYIFNKSKSLLSTHTTFFIKREARYKRELKLELDENIRTSTYDISRKGMFIKISNEKLFSRKKNIAFSLTLPNNDKITGQCRIKWFREEESGDSPKGFGTEILSLSEGNKKSYYNFLETFSQNT